MPAFESTSKIKPKSPPKAHQVGERAEALVLSQMQARGYQVVAKNKKIAGVEVDLIFKKENWVFIEVKKIRSLEETHFRISKNQIRRLHFARHFWEDLKNEIVELIFAFVCHGKVQMIRAEDLLD